MTTDPDSRSPDRDLAPSPPWTGRRARTRGPRRLLVCVCAASACADAVASMPWASSQEAPAPEQAGLLSYFTSGLSGYVPLRSSERSSEEEAYLSLSRWERYVLGH